MTRSLLADAFDHNSWATLRLVDACLLLAPEQLATSVPGTYGTILDTVRHIVGADAWYLSTLTDGRVPGIDEDRMNLAELRAVMAANQREWAAFVAQDLDPDLVIVRRHADGSETLAPLGIRLAQVVHHGTDHRSQVCTALTTLGLEPPSLDVWDLASEQGRLTEIPAPG